MLRGGTYAEQVWIDVNHGMTPVVNGTADDPIIIQAYDDEDAIIDADGNFEGIFLRADYWQLRGFQIRNATQNLIVRGANHTRVVGMDFYRAVDIGCQVYGESAGGRATSDLFFAQCNFNYNGHEGFYSKHFVASEEDVDGVTVYRCSAIGNGYEGFQNTTDAAGFYCLNVVFDRCVAVGNGATGDEWSTNGAMHVGGDALVNRFFATENFGMAGGIMVSPQIDSSNYPRIYNSIIFHNYSPNGFNAACISVQDATHGHIRHCTLHNAEGPTNTYGVYYGGSSANFRVEFNSIDGNSDQCGWAGGGAHCTIDHNVMFGAASRPGTNRRNVDPAYVDPNANDFHVQVGSPCRDWGVGSGMAKDFYDDARPGPAETSPTAGAVEYI
jgi:hypothetical protein